MFDPTELGTFQPSIGAFSSTKNFFKGTIDECRMMNVSTSADWIKLSYLNQKKPPEHLPVISFDTTEYVFDVQDFWISSPVTPTVVGEVDSFSILPTLPASLSFDSKTGSISGAFQGASPKTDYIIRAYNMLGYSEDTISITIISTSSVFGGKTANNGLPTLIGIRGGAQPCIVFSVPTIFQGENLRFKLYNCKGAVVWSTVLHAGRLTAGVQTIPLQRASNTTMLPGSYFLEMTTLGKEGKMDVRKVAKATILSD
jgi:hypothetical protein